MTDRNFRSFVFILPLAINGIVGDHSGDSKFVSRPAGLRPRTLGLP
jgi:hypothetical protein